MSVEELSGTGAVTIQFMTTKEVAELCRTSPESVRWWRHVGTGPKSFRVGRRVLYNTAEVWRWLEELQSSERPGAGIPAVRRPEAPYEEGPQ